MMLFSLVGGLGLAGILCLTGWALAFGRPRIARRLPRDLMILAAHQDDCVIMAGECAIEAARQGGRVQVVYLTCGARDAHEPRVAIRRQECEKAWGLLGVGPEQLTSLNLPQADVEGPSLMTDADLDNARSAIAGLIRGLPAGAAVFIPAAGESHCDHRTLRHLALEAHTRADRPDVEVCETPEYNGFYALFQSPWRGLHVVAGCYPLLGKLLGERSAWKRATFAAGGRACRLLPDERRLETKRQMLRQFTSEGGEQLVEYFGYNDLFRPLDVRRALRQGETTRGYMRVGARWVGFSTLLLLLCTWMVCGAVAGLSVVLIGQSRRGPAGLLAGLWAGAAALACGVLAWRSAYPMRRSTYLVCASAFIIAGVAPWSALTEL